MTVFRNWTDKGERGFLLGFWNTHANFGSILTLNLGHFMLETLDCDWATFLLYMGIMYFIMGISIHLFLDTSPPENSKSEKPILNHLPVLNEEK